MFKNLVVVAISSIALYGMGGPSLVETTKLIKGEVNPLQEFVGTVKFDRNSNLAAQNSGVVQKINFEVGDVVKKGQNLVQIDSDVLNAQIEAAKASLENGINEEENSQKDYIRFKNLLERKAITQKEYDDSLLKKNTSNSNVKALEARLNELKIQKDKKAINAPYNGIIVDKKINLGEWVNAGTTLATIVDTQKVEITFNVPLNIFNGLKKGNSYDINVGENIIKGVLLGAIPSGDKLTRTFPVKFKANTKDIFVFDGQEAKVSLSKNGKQEALLLPRDSVIKRFGQNVVFAITDKMTAQMIPVQIVGFDGNSIAIAGQGLVPGMDIVVKGNERVFPNQAVKIINK